MRIGQDLGLPVFGVLKTCLHTWGQGVAWNTPEFSGDIPQAQLLVRAFDFDKTVPKFQIIFRGFQDLAGHFQGFFSHLDGGQMHRGSCCHGLPTGKSSESHGDKSGVSADHLNVTGRHSQLFCAYLCKRSLQALTHGQCASVDTHQTSG